MAPIGGNLAREHTARLGLRTASSSSTPVNAGTDRLAAGALWSEQDFVFATRAGAALDAPNVRREFRAVSRPRTSDPKWTPRELRHSFVCLMSTFGVPVEEIARLAGHASARTTEVVYRRELRPVLTTGAEVMDAIFNRQAPR